MAASPRVPFINGKGRNSPWEEPRPFYFYGRYWACWGSVVFVFLDFRDFLGHRLFEIRRGIRVIERLLELFEALVRLFEVVGVEDAEAVAYGRIFLGGDDLSRLAAASALRFWLCWMMPSM